MPKRIIYQDLLILPGLALLGLALLLVGLSLGSHLREVQLLRTAENSADRWLKSATSDPAALAKIFRNRHIDNPSKEILLPVTEFGRVFRIELYDAEGRLFYTSGHAGWTTETLAPSYLVEAVFPKDRPITKLLDTSSEPEPRTFASVVHPFQFGGERIGFLHFLVEQTRQAEVLTWSYGVIAAVTALLLLISMGACTIVIGFKIRDHWRAQEKINYLSQHDELTGLANRASFTRSLTGALEQRRRDGGQIAVLCVNVDKFKDVNDSLGHHAGDAMLRELAARLKANIRKADILARFDGDEFAVAFTGLSDAQEAAHLVNQIAESLRQPFFLAGETVECSLSIGVAVAPADGDDSSVLLRHSDLALVRARSDGRNGIRFFEREMDLTFLRRREREQDLKRALDRGEFDMNYQPQVWLSDETLCGHEALIRWHHPVHGKISPAYFISLAEESELIVPLGEWILRRACQDAASWPEPANVAINLSPVQFRNTSVSALVRGVLDETGLDPRRLELEITESLLMRDTETVLNELSKLRDLGVTIAMDDFGTGYSSLSYLSRFPFGKIKIDRSFVRCMHNDAAISAIIGCIIGLGRSLDVIIMAEGVETTEQAQTLRKLGCDQAQGYLYGRPASAAEAAKRIVEAARHNRPLLPRSHSAA